jgi:hypothetical protein
MEGRPPAADHGVEDRGELGQGGVGEALDRAQRVVARNPLLHIDERQHAHLRIASPPRHRSFPHRSPTRPLYFKAKDRKRRATRVLFQQPVKPQATSSKEINLRVDLPFIDSIVRTVEPTIVVALSPERTLLT